MGMKTPIDSDIADIDVPKKLPTSIMADRAMSEDSCGTATTINTVNTTMALKQGMSGVKVRFNLNDHLNTKIISDRKGGKSGLKLQKRRMNMWQDHGKSIQENSTTPYNESHDGSPCFQAEDHEKYINDFIRVH